MKNYGKLCNKLCNLVFRVTFPSLLKLKTTKGAFFFPPDTFSLGDNNEQSEIS